MIDFLYFLEALCIGFCVGSVPGPLLISAFSEILHHRLDRSLKIVWYCFVSELLVILCLFFSLKFFTVPKYIFYVLSSVGAFIILFFVPKIWKIKKIDLNKKSIFGFKKIFVLISSNGVYWLFFLTIIIPKVFGANHILWGGDFLFLFLFQLGWVAAMLIFIFLFSKFHFLFNNKKFIPIIFKLLSLGLIASSAKMFIDSWIFFRPYSLMEKHLPPKEKILVRSQVGIPKIR